MVVAAGDYLVIDEGKVDDLREAFLTLMVPYQHEGRVETGNEKSKGNIHQIDPKNSNESIM